jgi:hypothetical protein
MLLLMSRFTQQAKNETSRMGTWLGYFGHEHVRRIHSLLTARHGYRMAFSACKRQKFEALTASPVAEQERC